PAPPRNTPRPCRSDWPASTRTVRWITRRSRGQFPARQTRFSPMTIPALLDIRPEVAEALRSGRAVVALESTLIAHGLPWPVNVQTAHEAEGAIRNVGAVPA